MLPLTPDAAGTTGSTGKADRSSARGPRPQIRVGDPAGAARTLGAGFLAWLPVLALLALFSQVALLGLKPALGERERLARQDAVVAERELRLEQENATHLTRLEALADPVFRERVRRARRSEGFAAAPRPLSLALSE